MIKCSSKIIETYPTVDDEPMKVEASLKADTSAEVTAMGYVADGVEGLVDGTIISFGSTCLTADGDFGMLDSSGVWQFG